MAAMKVWDGTAWQTVAPFSERASVYVGPDAPVGVALAGDLWWDTDDVMALPGTPLLYSQITANVNFNATSAATATTVINPGSFTYDGNPVTIEFYAGLFQYPNSAGSSGVLNLFDGSTDLGQIAQVINQGTTSAAIGAPVLVRRRLTPTVGTHSYNVRGWVSPGGSSIIYAGLGGAGAYPPSYLQITRA